jgi:electron transport complex protein RnfB
VDAIVGATKLMHTVIAAECSGCDLCIPACPVDCIDVHHSPKIVESDEKARLKHQYKKRFDAREQRLYRIAESKKTHKKIGLNPIVAAEKKPAMSPLVAAALIRTQLKKTERQLLLAQERGAATSAIQTEILALQKELAALTR